jgi:hypothetical protein
MADASRGTGRLIQRYSQWLFFVVSMSPFVLEAALATRADAAPFSREQKMDMRGDLMIWTPALVPQCTGTGLYGKPEDPTTHIQCRSTWNNGVDRVPRGIMQGWVWSISVIRYPAPQRQLLYDAAKAAGHTHFTVQVTGCGPSTLSDPDGTAYHGMYPVTERDCRTDWLGQGGTYIDRLNTVLLELERNNLIAVCAGVSAVNPVAPGLNTAKCPVAMTNWDNHAVDNKDGTFSDSMDCRVRAAHQSFGEALIYVELPTDWMPAAGLSSPTFPQDSLQERVPFLRGFMSGGTTRRP